MDLRKLEIFNAVVEVGSFSAAAERLLLTQSAVSQHMAELEASLGTALFRRGRRGVDLTPAGQTLADYARHILTLMNEARLAVTNVEKLESGHLTLGATPGVGSYLLPAWIQSFRERHPQIIVSLSTDVTDKVIAQVLERRLDLAFIEGEIEDHPELELPILQEVPQWIVVSPSHVWADLPFIRPDMLHGQPFIMRHNNSRSRQWLEVLLEQNHIRPQVVAEFDNPEAIKRAVSAGMGVAVLPQYVMQNELNLGQLAALRLEGIALQRTLKLAWKRAEPFTPVAQAFLTQLAPRFPSLLLTRKG